MVFGNFQRPKRLLQCRNEGGGLDKICETVRPVVVHFTLQWETRETTPMHRIGSPLALPGLATPVDFQPEQNKIQTKENKQTKAGNMKLKKQEKPKPKLNPKKKKNYQMGITSCHNKQQQEETRSNSSSWQQESKRKKELT